MWHVSTDHDEFFHTPKVRDISYRRRRIPKHSLGHLPHSVSIIDTWLSCWKASQTFRWSVWWIFQLTNRPPDTPAPKQCGRGGVAGPARSHAHTVTVLPLFVICFMYFISVSLLWVSSFVLTVKCAPKTVSAEMEFGFTQLCCILLSNYCYTLSYTLFVLLLDHYFSKGNNGLLIIHSSRRYCQPKVVLILQATVKLYALNWSLILVKIAEGICTCRSLLHLVHDYFRF